MQSAPPLSQTRDVGFLVCWLVKNAVKNGCNAVNPKTQQNNGKLVVFFDDHLVFKTRFAQCYWKTPACLILSTVDITDLCVPWRISAVSWEMFKFFLTPGFHLAI